MVLLKHLGIPDCFATLRFARNAAVQPVFKKAGNEPTVHHVKLPSAPSAMYFDKEKGRWRERGKEHLEEEESSLPPPPSMGSKPAGKPERAQQENKEAWPLDSMMAPPNLHGNRFARKHTAATVPALPAAGAEGADFCLNDDIPNCPKKAAKEDIVHAKTKLNVFEDSAGAKSLEVITDFVGFELLLGQAKARADAAEQKARDAILEANARADAAEERAAAAIAEAHARAHAAEQKAEAAIAEANARAAAAEEKSTAVVCYANAHFKALEEQLAQALGKLHATPLPGTTAESVTGKSAAEEAAQQESAEELAGGGARVQRDEVHQLVNVLDEHSSDLEACSQACKALERLIFTDESHEAKVADLGGVELILHILETHPHEATYLLLPVLQTLRSLTFHEKSVECATAANGASRVSKFLANTLCTPELLGEACAVLLNLSAALL